jgi:hypothetical protein
MSRTRPSARLPRPCARLGQVPFQPGAVAWRAIRASSTPASALPAYTHRFDRYIGDPVALAPSQPGVHRFAVEIRGGGAQPRRFDVLERVDVDDGVEAIVDLARHERHDAAARAHVKRRRARSERIPGDGVRARQANRQASARSRRPHAAMLGAERAAARARRDLRRVTVPIEIERHVAAMAAALDQHGSSASDRGRAALIVPAAATPEQPGWQNPLQRRAYAATVRRRCKRADAPHAPRNRPCTQSRWRHS